MSATAGKSAREEYERRRGRREARLRQRFGRAAPLAGLIGGEPASERAWRVGAEGEERLGKLFAKLLEPKGVLVLHDLRIPGSRANIDHLAVGPGGVTVIDAKNYRGKVAVRGGKLWVGGRNRTKVVEGMLGQMEVVAAVLAETGFGDVPVRGALAWVNHADLPFLPLKLKGVLINGPRRVAKFARRRGTMSSGECERVSAALAAALSG